MDEKYVIELEQIFVENSALILLDGEDTKKTSMDSFMRKIISHIDEVV